MKIYISGPISGGLDYEQRKRAFQAIEDMLAKQGHEVSNPTKNGLPLYAPYSEHMREDLRELTRCDAIFLMEGWQQSAGCQLEYAVACACGLSIMDDVQF